MVFLHHLLHLQDKTLQGKPVCQEELKMASTMFVRLHPMPALALSLQELSQILRLVSPEKRACAALSLLGL